MAEGNPLSYRSIDFPQMGCSIINTVERLFYLRAWQAGGSTLNVFLSAIWRSSHALITPISMNYIFTVALEPWKHRLDERMGYDWKSNTNRCSWSNVQMFFQTSNTNNTVHVWLSGQVYKQLSNAHMPMSCFASLHHLKRHMLISYQTLYSYS